MVEASELVETGNWGKEGNELFEAKAAGKRAAAKAQKTKAIRVN